MGRRGEGQEGDTEQGTGTGNGWTDRRGRVRSRLVSGCPWVERTERDQEGGKVGWKDGGTEGERDRGWRNE